MDTITELGEWMESHCYSFQNISIGNHYAPEGLIIEAKQGSYQWCCSERGQKSILAVFDSEQELVQYAWQQIQKDKWWKAHLLVFTKELDKIVQITTQLEILHVSYERNDIPTYCNGKPVYRIFVFGCDYESTKHLEWIRY